MKDKLLYLMHVDWNWIKQRPQFIEEELEKYYEVDVFCPRNYRLRNYEDKLNVHVFYPLPYLWRFPYIWKVDYLRKKIMIRKLIKLKNPSTIYVTSPELGSCIPDDYTGQVAYDCMDDMLAFSKERFYIHKTYIEEKSLVKRSDFVFASSKNLKEVLIKRYNDIEMEHKTNIIRNGYNGNIENTIHSKDNNLFTLCYFGTISHWFNFEFIIKSLDRFDNLEYIIIGPIESGTSIPKHNRIKYIPPIRHDQIFEFTKNANAFIMPFKLNQLILSVDPVKLYEYINFNKNILCIKYPEIERYDKFVYFYNDYSSFENQILSMQKNKKTKYSNTDRIKFLNENTWENRVNEIVRILSR